MQSLRNARKRLQEQVKRLGDSEVKAGELDDEAQNYHSVAEEINQRVKLPHKTWGKYEKKIKEYHLEYVKEKTKQKLNLKDISKKLTKWKELIAHAVVFVGLESKTKKMAAEKQFLAEQAELLSDAERFVKENEQGPNSNFSTTAKVTKVTMHNKNDGTLKQPLLGTPTPKSPQARKDKVAEVRQKLEETKASLVNTIKNELQKTPDAFAKAEELNARYGSQHDLTEPTKKSLTPKAKKSSSGFWCCCSKSETEDDIDRKSNDKTYMTNNKRKN